MRTHLRLTLTALSVSLALAACGGGGGDSPKTSPATGGTPIGTGGTTGTPTTPSTFPTTSASMTMACVDAPDVNTTAQCSGNVVAITPDKGNGVLATNSGVQVYARSTSDLQKTIQHPDTATGFELATGGLAEVRLLKGTTSFAVSKPALLLSNFGIKWDGVNESPMIIETFQPTQGRVKLDSSNRIVADQYHEHNDTAFYDFITLDTKATKANYANNRYFPRADPIRCPTTSCASAETTGIKTVVAGDWQKGGTEPDINSGTRLHEDGDVHAGDLPGATGGVPFPGSKGYRDFLNMSYQYANVTKWVSQDTAEIAEWAGTNNEHNQNRRGIVAFGDVTDPTKMPTTGTASYKGWARGWYAPNNSTDPTPFLAEATISVDFATRQVSIKFDGAKSDDTANAPLAAAQFTTSAAFGAANTNVASYLTGAIANGNLKGGIGGRFFGPANGATPPEVGASFSLSDAGTGASLIGGFIAVKRP